MPARVLRLARSPASMRVSASTLRSTNAREGITTGCSLNRTVSTPSSSFEKHQCPRGYYDYRVVMVSYLLLFIALRSTNAREGITTCTVQHG